MSDFNTMFDFYKKRRQTILQSDADVKKEEICSSLSECNISELDDLMEKDSELKKLMFTPAKELPQRYLYLLEEIDPNMMQCNLYTLIISSLGWGSKIHSYFSKSGNKIVGWCAYHISKKFNGVDEIKMFSFDLDKPNLVLLRDLKNLVDRLLTEYSFVSWGAVPENPANRIYERALAEYENKGFDVEKVQSDKEITYTVTNKNLINSASSIYS